MRAPTLVSIADDELEQFQEAMVRWLSLLGRLPETIKFTPIQMLSMFVRLQEIHVGNECLLEGRLTNVWAGNGSQETKRMWFHPEYLEENGGISRQTQYFNECLEYLRSDTPPIVSHPIAPRKPLPPKKRSDLWKREFGDKPVGECYVCSMELVKKEKTSWHAGHILAHANGGSDTDLTNFVIECRDCNLAHGTENPIEYKKRNYSE